jgi:hypothetical protein
MEQKGLGMVKRIPEGRYSCSESDRNWVMDMARCRIWKINTAVSFNFTREQRSSISTTLHSIDGCIICRLGLFHG